MKEREKLWLCFLVSNLSSFPRLWRTSNALSGKCTEMEAGEKGGVRRERKEIFKPTCMSGRKAFRKPQTRGCFLMLTVASHQATARARLETPLLESRWVATEDNHVLDQETTPEGHVILNHWLHWYNNIYIYIYICMCVCVCVMYKRLRYQAPLDHIPPSLTHPTAQVQ